MRSKKVLAIAATALLLGGAARPAFAQVCAISAEEEARLLALPYQEFDQALEGEGWRSFGDRGCYVIAASLLNRYNGLHRAEMTDWQIRVVTWHAGQMYAFSGDVRSARARFESSYDANEPADTPLLWNDYVSATLAFLDKDLEKLRLHRDRIANGPVWNGERGNLRVVNALLKCIEMPYAFAYSDASCRD